MAESRQHLDRALDAAADYVEAKRGCEGLSADDSYDCTPRCVEEAESARASFAKALEAWFEAKIEEKLGGPPLAKGIFVEAPKR